MGDRSKSSAESGEPAPARDLPAFRGDDESFRRLIELLPDPVVIRVGLTIVLANRAALQLFRASSPDQVVGQDSMKLIPPEGRALAEERLARVRAGEAIPLLTQGFVRLDGTCGEAEMTSTLVTFDGERALLTVARDVSERRAAEREREAAAAARHQADVRARALFHAVPIAMTGWQRVERDGVVDFAMVDYNQAALDLSEGVIAGFVGRTTRELGRPYLSGEILAKTLRDGVASREEVDYVTPSGATRRLNATYIPVPPDIVLVHAEDLTERVALEAQLRHAQKMDAIGQLAGGVAHDFNNQLTVIIGQLGLVLEQTPEHDPNAEPLREALVAANRSAELTRQLLAFARGQPVATRVLDLNEQITGALAMLRRLVGSEVEIVWTPHAAPWLVKLDPTQVHQLLTNLVVNARDALSGAGRVRITTENVTLDEAFAAQHPGAPTGEHVALTVSDTGAGMSAEVRARIFEPFFTTKDAGHGTGLGLAIVYGIVRQNGGYITVESEPGAGTTFRIWFPRATGEAARAAPPDEAPRGHETLLVVEDERAVLDLAETMLLRLGYEVLRASCPSEAIALFAANAARVALVLSDVVMPEMSGRELVRELRAIKPGQRALLMSGYAPRALGPAGPGDERAMLHKPFSLSDLARAVRQALDAPGAPA